MTRKHEKPQQERADSVMSDQESARDQRPDLIDVWVTMERPSSESLESLQRDERYRALHTVADEQRKALEQWIADHGLSESVSSIGEATAFNLLFATLTPEAAAALLAAPGVVAVAPVDESAIQLLAARGFLPAAPQF
ncbi:MAG: hypothetical protein IPK16_00800 [Anaerolineales bacterium]|nr:hypothetical protein [Anaerolineales bacterium]